jgi:8-oxo-dGTP diphosphatase
VVRASRHAEIKFDAREFQGVRWFAFDEVPLERADPHMKRFLEKFVEHTCAIKEN